MPLDDMPMCKFCKQPIMPDQRWEYTKTTYRSDTPEHKKDRAHKACVAILSRKPVEPMDMPEDERK